MEPSTATGVLRILPSTQAEVAHFAKAVVQSVMNGEANPLEIHVMLKGFEKAAELISDAIRTNVMSELDRYSEKSIQAFGARVDKAEVGTKYKYETACDPIWELRKVVLEQASVSLKERETFLRTLREPMTIIDETTGEINTIKPPQKVSTSGLKITLC